ncbi:nitrilase-related carbon-nitrogen hydrolase [Chakrabartyella piscis]|uniref:nitrilase-related carbon-nitrogen hydrolase n=1 Tax=Chakrabartyella piscis TaxID=2918914 RepID=UPI002958D8E9|nr:nitrilase-related carbon-nitrogen hydrolase [Chakrabartyella piscis]
MKIALGQLDMGFEEKEKAMEICSQMIAEAGDLKADLIVFPEMTLTGFTMKPAIYGENIASSESIAFFQKEAKKNHIAICFGITISENEVFTNRSLVLDAEGTILADYGKLHLFFGPETKRYSGGDELQYCQIDGVPLSPFVCYDLRFPEPFLIASDKSHIITVIACWPEARREHWMTLLRARAIENQCFIIGVNRTGVAGKLNYVGDSMVISPNGDILAHVKEKDSLTIVDIQPEEVVALREQFPQKGDRRPDLYIKLASQD